MKVKTVQINKCDDCPFFDNIYYDYNARCTKLDRVIELDEGEHFVHPIPDDCPLDNVEEVK